MQFCKCINIIGFENDLEERPIFYTAYNIQEMLCNELINIHLPPTASYFFIPFPYLSSLRCFYFFSTLFLFLFSSWFYFNTEYYRRFCFWISPYLQVQNYIATSKQETSARSFYRVWALVHICMRDWNISFFYVPVHILLCTFELNENRNEWQTHT